MISSPTLVLIEEFRNNKKTYINPSYIVAIHESDFKAGIWKITLINEHVIHIKSDALKTILDHCEVLVPKL